MDVVKRQSKTGRDGRGAREGDSERTNERTNTDRRKSLFCEQELRVCRCFYLHLSLKWDNGQPVVKMTRRGNGVETYVLLTIALHFRVLL